MQPPRAVLPVRTKRVIRSRKAHASAPGSGFRPRANTNRSCTRRDSRAPRCRERSSPS
jgi:hypothetical protein